ncbi:DUF4349 domain-containing protein [bacterium]|nr:DUF4349 domain-containing protein [bacterium]
MNEKNIFANVGNLLPVPLLVVLALLFFLLAVILGMDSKEREKRQGEMGVSSREEWAYVDDQGIAPASGSPEFSEEYNASTVSSDTALPSTMSLPPISNAGRPAPEGIERQIVYNASLSLLVARVEDAITALKSIAVERGGRTENVDFQDASYNQKKRATVVLRVPQAEFDKTVEQVKGVGIRVEHENISANDVTDQMVDIDARLANLRAEEAQYQKIMEDAEKIPDILQVSQYLFQIREQIEMLQAQKENLASDVGMSRIAVSLSSDPEVQALPTGWNPTTSMEQAFQVLVIGLIALADFLIVLVGVLFPLLILWGLLIIIFVWIIWKILHAVKQRIFGSSRSTSTLATPASVTSPPVRTYSVPTVAPITASAPMQNFTSKSFPPSPSTPTSSKKNGGSKKT